MPWSIEANHSSCPSSKPYAVVKDDDGAVSGCHATREGAAAQQRSLYASEKSMSDETEEAEDTEATKEIYYPLYGVTSFAELDELAGVEQQRRHSAQLTEHFTLIARNIAQDGSIEDKAAALHGLADEYGSRLKMSVRDDNLGLFKAMGEPLPEPDDEMMVKAAIKRENGMDFPARDYGFVPNPDLPSTWRLRLAEVPGRVTLNQLARAAAALSAGGFRGNKAQIPATALAAVKRRIRAEFRRLGVEEGKIPQSVKATKGIRIYKSKETGQYRWFAIYSNRYRDQDTPPEIISEKAHLAYTHLVRAGVIAYPELWHWHTKGTAWGQADWVGYEDGFACAAGYVLPGHEKAAEALMATDEEIGVSHGMTFIQYNAKEKSVIDFYVSIEISDLLATKAANKLTGFIVHEEKDDIGHSPSYR